MRASTRGSSAALSRRDTAVGASACYVIFRSYSLDDNNGMYMATSAEAATLPIVDYAEAWLWLSNRGILLVPLSLKTCMTMAAYRLALFLQRPARGGDENMYL